MRYEPESLVPFTWCPTTGAPVLVDKCSGCENFIKLIKERDASDNIPLPSYKVRCRYPGDRDIYVLDNKEIVSCAKLKYNPYVSVPECEMCNFFVKKIVKTNKDGSKQPAVLCSVPTLRVVAYKWKDFKTIDGGDEL